MPKPFDDCYKAGGKITTQKLSDNKYRHICWLRGKSYKGHIKTKKSKQ